MGSAGARTRIASVKDVDAIHCATEPLINWKKQSAVINKHKNPRGAELLDSHIGEKNSSFAGLKERPFLDTKVILEIIKKLRNKYYAKNGLKSDSLTLGIAYWYDRLLAQKKLSIHEESDVKTLKESLKFFEQVTFLDEGKTGKVFSSIADIYMKLER